MSLTRYDGAIHLLLTDVVMPGMNGRVLADRLRIKRPETRILYMSGYTDSILSTQGVLDQSTNLLYKPFTEEQLIDRVRGALKTGLLGERARAHAESKVTATILDHHPKRRSSS